MNDMAKNLVLWLVIAVVLLAVFQSFSPSGRSTDAMSYTSFVQQVDSNNVGSVTISAGMPPTITGKLRDGSALRTVAPAYDSDLVTRLLKHGVQVTQVPADGGNILVKILIDWVPILLIFGVLFWFMRQMQSGGGGRGAMSFGRSRAKLQGEDQVKVTFADVAGCEEAKDEVRELVDFLKDPAKFQKLGGRIPRGVLLAGSPGTGKTLLAKAIAGEAKVPFFSISGSDFVEMFVRVGAARVRDMFEQAKKHAPCIIFIDEIDAVGRHRGAGLGGGND